MKKKIGYILLILISILGSRLIFGRDYHLNSNNLVDDNLYLYDIFNQKNVTLTMVLDEDLYYVLNSANNQYTIVKYDLISNKVVSEYILNTNHTLKNIKMFKEGNNLYLTAINSNIYYVFNKNLEFISKNSTESNYETYGIMNDNFITIVNNQVFNNDYLYDTIPSSCGKIDEIIYNKNTYLHFYNVNTGFGCMYNVNTKKREYLDYEKMDIANNRLLEYQDNRISFNYDNSTYYFNDITESNNLKMHDNGDYLFTINNTTNTLKIYNLETKRIIYEKVMLEINNSKVDNLLIDDYAYFTVTKDNITKLYIWDYLKEARSNKNMTSFNEKEYKFKNNELKEEIKTKYNVDVYIYDGAVTYFPNYFVIPSTDDILINSRLIILRDILSGMSESERMNLIDLKIYFVKNIVEASSNINYDVIKTNKDNKVYMAIDITNEDFKNTFKAKIQNISDIFMYIS